jgi:hypothetical protein
VVVMPDAKAERELNKHSKRRPERRLAFILSLAAFRQVQNRPLKAFNGVVCVPQKQIALVTQQAANFAARVTMVNYQLSIALCFARSEANCALITLRFDHIFVIFDCNPILALHSLLALHFWIWLFEITLRAKPLSAFLVVNAFLSLATRKNVFLSVPSAIFCILTVTANRA